MLSDEYKRAELAAENENRKQEQDNELAHDYNKAPVRCPYVEWRRLWPLGVC